eukprot:gene7226-7993_t
MSHQELVYTFGILLPIKITSKESLSPIQEQRLSELARKLISNPPPPPSSPSSQQEQFSTSAIVYLGLDEDLRDTPLPSLLTSLFQTHGVPTKPITFFPLSKAGKICHYWRTLAKQSIADGCDFFLLLGDDVEIYTDQWMDSIVHDFQAIHHDLNLPKELFGFGCIALQDTQAPGFPTFPVLHRLHATVLEENIFDEVFVNQDADPYLFALYRRFQCARFASKVSLRNHCGGVQLFDDIHYELPRYDRVHVLNWRDELLDRSVQQVRMVPTYRVQRSFLKGILALRPKAKDIDLFFILIVDNPEGGEGVQWLRGLEKERNDLRVRVHEKNLGASEARNNGLREASGEYVLFLDDDVIPDPLIVDEYIEMIRDEQVRDQYDGFVGYSELPSEDRIFPTAVHFSAAAKMKEVPWGITANLMVRRRAAKPFHLDYIKTGGGEDIDFCLQLPKQPLKSVPLAKIRHPWWENGKRCYHHFFNWSYSDGFLQDRFPALTYYNYPDAIESMMLIGSFSWMISLPLRPLSSYSSSSFLLPTLWTAVLLTDTLLDVIQIGMYSDKEEMQCQGWKRWLAAVESSFIKNYSSLGRVVGHLQRGRLLSGFCRRFDWFCGITPSVVEGEIEKAKWRFLGYAVVVSALVYRHLN